jgi:hypothetical protein
MRDRKMKKETRLLAVFPCSIDEGETQSPLDAAEEEAHAEALRPQSKRSGNKEPLPLL